MKMLDPHTARLIGFIGICLIMFVPVIAVIAGLTFKQTPNRPMTKLKLIAWVVGGVALVAYFTALHFINGVGWPS
jgi:hypothetical protein